MINLATHAKNQTQTITIRFKNTTMLVLNNVTLYRVNNNEFQRDALNFKANPLRIISRDERMIKGRITTTADKPLIMTTIPDAPGWRIKIDGRPIKAQQVADYFLAIKTTPGQHIIQFTYTPPYFLIGLYISLLASATLLVPFIYNKILAR